MNNLVRYFPVDDEAARLIAGQIEPTVLTLEESIPPEPDAYPHPESGFFFLSPDPFRRLLDGDPTEVTTAFNHHLNMYGIALYATPVDDLEDQPHVEVTVHSSWLTFRVILQRSLLKQEARRPNSVTKLLNRARTALTHYIGI